MYVYALYRKDVLQEDNQAQNLPIVEIKVDVKASSENRNRMHVFPTPESPISRSLNNRSYVFLAISQDKGALN